MRQSRVETKTTLAAYDMKYSTSALASRKIFMIWDMKYFVVLHVLQQEEVNERK